MSVIDYKIRARGKVNWRLFDTVRLEISVGKSYHEGAKLAATLEWARNNFDRQVIILGDAPQRFNIMFEGNFSESEAYRMALVKGDVWLQKYAHLLTGIDVTRWDEWKNANSYNEIHRAVIKLYDTDLKFRNALQEAIRDVWDRKYYSYQHKARFFDFSEQYLLEETAVFAVAYETLGGVSAYPGDFLELWEMFIDSQSPVVPKGLTKAHCTRLCFNRKKASQIAA